MAEFLHRVNYGLGMGNFELDYDDGEIRLKTSNDFHGLRPTHEVLHRLIYYNAYALDQHLPAIQAVLQGTAPTEALESLEN
jgi:hypothetical protein